MTENNTSTNREKTVESIATHSNHECPFTQSRRRLLETLTSGGTLLLAGCGQDEANNASTPTSNATKQGAAASRLLNQTLRVPVAQNPDRVSFYAPFAENYQPMENTFAVTPKNPVSERLAKSIREPSVWTTEEWVGGDIHYTWLNDITITSSEVTVTIHKDAVWSDGNPITGADIAVVLMSYYISRIPPYWATEEKDEPTIAGGAIDGFDVRTRSVTYRSSEGYFDLFWDSTLADIAVSKVVPTHIEPYGTYTDAVFETAHRAIEGEINPWKGWGDPRVIPDDPHAASLVEKHLAKEGKYVTKFSNPEHVISTSAWDLVELDGPEAVFEPNPHHRHAEQINFDQLVLEYTPDEQRARAALTAGRLDYAMPGPTPQTVIESLPENITQLQIPGERGSGNELRLDFTHPALGNRKVRLALMYALDQSTIANNIHQSAALPVTNPGGDCWDATDFVSEEWIDENLSRYTHDRAKAASLMREGGYTRDGGQWINADGEPLTLLLPTKSSTPRWEPTVASQLSEFGIQTSVQTLNEATFESRKREGEFSMWAESGVTTSTAPDTLLFWYVAAKHPKVFGVYPRKQFKTGNFSDQGVPIPRTKERYNVFTIEAPPIGQSNGPLQEYHPAALGLFWVSNPPEAEFRRRVKTGIWLANWFLPTIPINKTVEQHFIDDAHWQWPTDTPAWQAFTGGGPKSINGIFASGTVQANPDNPEQA